MEDQARPEMSWHDLLLIYRRRRTVILSAAIVCGILAILYCSTATRVYQSSGTLEVQKDASGDLSLDSVLGGGGAGGDLGGSLDLNTTLQTQASILESDTLALKTIKDLNLEDTRDFKSGVLDLDGLFGGSPDPVGGTLENSPRRRRRVLLRFANNLSIEPLVGTRLIEIKYSHSDPKVAAAVVNRLTQSLMDYNFQTRFDATNQASVWLRGQLEDLRKETEGLQTKVSDLQRQSGVYSFGTTDARGNEEAYSSIIDRLQQSTTAVTNATQNRILKGAIAKAAEVGDAELLSGLAGNAPSGTPTQSSLAVIQALRQEETDRQAAFESAASKFGPAYPKLGELKAAVDATRVAIKAEVDRLRGRAESDYQIAQQTENATRLRYENDKKQADLLNDKAINFVLLRQEAEQSRQLYELLLTRLKGAGVLAGLKSSNITVVDTALAPARPHKPMWTLIIPLGFVAGLVLGIAIAMLQHLTDRKVHTVEDVESVSGESIFGLVPQFHMDDAEAAKTDKEKLPLMAMRSPQSTFTEAIRAVRSSIFLARGDKPPQVILITSAVPGEGKTTFSLNLAFVMALQSSRVLLVETDLRRGALAKRLGIERGPGLSALLSGLVSEAPILTLPDVPNLFILQGGSPAPPNPSELLGSSTMKRWLEQWKNEYDFIILDAPPVLPVTDAIILEPLAELTLVMARSEVTEQQQLERALRILKNSAVHYIGIILNGLSPRDQSYYGYYGYYGYRDNAYSEGDSR